MFVFRNQSNQGDDCALIVDQVVGWDVTSEALLVKTMNWDIDDWRANGVEDARLSFDDAKRQLLEVVGCNYTA